jgi:hypothetical protein
MLRVPLITALLVALLIPAPQQTRSAVDAPRFVLLEGGFSIALPERFKQQTRLAIPTPSGSAHGNLYEWQTKDVTFGVGYAVAYRPIGEPQPFFDLAIEIFKKLTTVMNGDFAGVKKITLDNHPGIEQRAKFSKGAFIQRTYLVPPRIYQTLVVVTNSKRDEGTALSVLDSFKLLNDAEITEEALKTAPSLPQMPETPRAGTDAADQGLRGPVKSVRNDPQYVSETPFTQDGPRSTLTTYNEKGNKLRTETYDYKNNLFQITVYGYVDGRRVSASKFVPREYGPSVGIGPGRSLGSDRKMDPRYSRWVEFKYDEKKRLIERTDFLSNDDIMERHVYKYDANQKEEFVYSPNDSLPQRYLYILDDKGNEIELTSFAADGSVNSKTTYTYEFDSNGNWTRQTVSRNVMSESLRKLPIPLPSAHLRTITYY